MLSTYTYQCHRIRCYPAPLKVPVYSIHPLHFAACIATWSYRLLLHVDSCIIHAIYTVLLCVLNACQTGVTTGTSVQLPSGRRWVRLRREGPAVILATGDILKKKSSFRIPVITCDKMQACQKWCGLVPGPSTFKNVARNSKKYESYLEKTAVVW